MFIQIYITLYDTYAKFVYDNNYLIMAGKHNKGKEDVNEILKRI